MELLPTKIQQTQLETPMLASATFQIPGQSCVNINIQSIQALNAVALNRLTFDAKTVFTAPFFPRNKPTQANVVELNPTGNI